MDGQTIELHELPFDPAQPSRGGWACVELMGHRQLVGFVREVQCFGVAMCEIRIEFAGTHDVHVHAASAIYGIHPCLKPTVGENRPQLPAARDTEVDPSADGEDDEDDGDDGDDGDDWNDEAPA